MGAIITRSPLAQVAMNCVYYLQKTYSTNMNMNIILRISRHNYEYKYYANIFEY